VTTPATHALAPAFTHTSEAPDVSLSFNSGPSPVTASVATGTYRMCLAPVASDFIRAMQAAINAALVGAGRSETVTCTLSAAGIFTFTISDPAALNTFGLGTVTQRRLGFTVAPGASPASGNVPVWYLALMSCATGAYWQPRQPGGAEVTNGGRVYTFASTITAWARKLKVEYQPTTPAMRAAHATDATALYPADEYMGALGSTSTAREWSVLDVLYASRNALCGYTSTWGTARTSTTERIWRAYVAPASLLSLTTELYRTEWLAYSTWPLEMSADATTPTETRA
jgi:hypothetical protein